MNRNLSWALVAVLSILAGGRIAWADASLPKFEEDIQKLSVAIAAQVNGAPIRVEPFRDLSIGKYSGKGAAGLRQLFVTFLEQAGAHLGEDSDQIFILTAKFAISEQPASSTDPAATLLTLSIQPILESSSGAEVPLHPIEGAIEDKVLTTDTSVVARYAGITGATVSDQAHGGQVSKDDRHRDLQKAAHAPQGTIIDGNRILATPHSKYRVQVLVYETELSHGLRVPVGQGVPAAATLEKGHPYVDIPLDAIYELVIENSDNKPVAVETTIDGLSIFQFSAPEFNDAKTGRPLLQRHIVPAHESALLPGWFVKVEKPDNVLSFLVTNYGQGAASKLGLPQSHETGAIHLQFSHCTQLDAKPKGAGRSSAGGKETDTGVPKTVDQKLVNFEVDPPHEFLTIRYSR